MHPAADRFAESDFRNFLRRDGVVEARIARGELKAGLLRGLYLAFGGTPGFLGNLRDAAPRPTRTRCVTTWKACSPEGLGTWRSW